MKTLLSRRSAQRGQGGMAMMAGLVIYVGLSGLALVALLNMSFTSLRIASIQESDSQELRAVDSALQSAVNELRHDASHATATPNGDGSCLQSLGRRGDRGLLYDDGLGNRVLVQSRCSAAADRLGAGEVSLTALMVADGKERRQGTARLAVRPTDTGQLVIVNEWSVRPDERDDPIPPDTTTTTVAPTTTAPTTTSTTTVPPTSTIPATAEWALTITSDWTTGYCADVQVTNPTKDRLDWVVTVPVDGTIYIFWSGEYSASAESATVKGADWNRTLDAGASTNFGFCANRPSTAPSAAEWSQTITSDWTSGYCADVLVTNPTKDRLDWVVEIPIDGTIYIFWSGEYSASAKSATVKGTDWNRTLDAGATTNFGYCANR